MLCCWEIDEIIQKVSQHWVADSIAERFEKDQIIGSLKRELGKVNQEEVDDLESDLEWEQMMRFEAEMDLTKCEAENKSLKSKLKKIEESWIKMTGNGFEY